MYIAYQWVYRVNQESNMFGILSSTFRTATREDVWGHRHHTPEDAGLLAEADRRSEKSGFRWRAPATWVRR